MLDIGWSELILIGVVALIVIGPKDLPDMFRQLGRFTAKLRTMARDFQRAMDQAATESGVKDVAADLKSVASSQSLGLNAMRDAAAKFEKWDPLKNAARPTVNLPLVPLVPPAPAADLPVAASAIGPETQALRDRQAERQAIIAETTERLRNANARPDPATPPADPAAKVKTRKAALVPDPAASPPKPRKAAKPGGEVPTHVPAEAPAKPKRKASKADPA